MEKVLVNTYIETTDEHGKVGTEQCSVPTLKSLRA